MKYSKYIVILLAVLGMLYVKNKIDTKNKSDVQAIEELDQDETPTPAIKIKTK